MRYVESEPIRATPEIVYHAARSAFAIADEAGIDSIATYLWVIREGYGTARPAHMAEALIRAAADHGTAAINLRRIAILRTELRSQAILARGGSPTADTRSASRASSRLAGLSVDTARGLRLMPAGRSTAVGPRR